MHVTACEIARQNQKNGMELNKLKKSRSKSIQIEKYPESNKWFDDQPKHSIDFNLAKANKKYGTFHSQYKSHYYLHIILTFSKISK